MSPPLIAIVNDDHHVLALFTMLLRKAGYPTVTHRQGAGAHELITQNRPALLILDIVMEQPDSGWRVLDALRRDPATQQLPVLIYSGQTNVPEQLQERADRYCGVLPFGTSVETLLTGIQQWLPPRDAAAGSA